MTHRTGRIATMITRVGAGRMLVNHTQPVVGGMALITRYAGHEVPARLAGGCIAVMAGRTGTGRYIVVVERRRQPCNG